MGGAGGGGRGCESIVLKVCLVCAARRLCRQERKQRTIWRLLSFEVVRTKWTWQVGGGGCRNEETRSRWLTNQWAVHLDWIQPGKSPRSREFMLRPSAPYMSHTQGSEKVPGSTLKPLSKKKKKNLVDKTTNKSVSMPHKQQSCSTCRTSHQRGGGGGGRCLSL